MKILIQSEKDGSLSTDFEGSNKEITEALGGVFLTILSMQGYDLQMAKDYIEELVDNIQTVGVAE